MNSLTAAKVRDLKRLLDAFDRDQAKRDRWPRLRRMKERQARRLFASKHSRRALGGMWSMWRAR